MRWVATCSTDQVKRDIKPRDQRFKGVSLLVLSDNIIEGNRGSFFSGHDASESMPFRKYLIVLI